MKFLFVSLWCCLFLACKPQEKAESQALMPVQAKARLCERKPQHDDLAFRCFQLHFRADGHETQVLVISKKHEVGQHRGTPVISIPGGPGQGSQTGGFWLEAWEDWYISSHLDADLILYEPRGNKGTNSYWRCEAYEEAILHLLGQNKNALEESRYLQKITQQCLSKYESFLTKLWGKKQALRHLNTEQRAEDLGGLMKALGYDRYVLWGTSYGTRVAMRAAANTRVSRLVLDSPYPFHRGTMTDWPELLAGAFHRHARAFQASFGSEKTYRDLFNDSRLFLNQHPQHFRLTHWDDASTVAFVLNGDRLLSLQFDMLYDTSFLEPFYQGLMQLTSVPSDKNNELIWALEFYVSNLLDADFSTMSFMATECNDNSMPDKVSFLAHARQYNIEGIDWAAFYDLDVCHYAMFSAPEEEPTINKVQAWELVHKPAIIFSGGLDPVTPRLWANELHARLNGSVLAVENDMGHGILASGHCDWRAVYQAIDAKKEKIEMHCEQQTLDEPPKGAES